VYSKEDQGEESFTFDARRSRVGLRAKRPSVAGWGGLETTARVEIDFHGDFVTENKATVLLRQLYWEAKTKAIGYSLGSRMTSSPRLFPAR